MNKICTSLEQSQRLIELGIDVNTADMYYPNRVGIDNYALSIEWKSGNPLLSQEIPAWSLAALLNYLKSKNKFPEIKELSDGRFKLTTYIWDGKDCIQVSIGDTIVDACYELVLKLHELKML